MNPWDNPNLKEFHTRSVEAHLQKFCSRSGLPFNFLRRSTEPSLEVDDINGRLVLEVFHLAYGFGDANAPPARVVEHTLAVEVPATWWDAFKLHFFLRWWLRWLVARKPVQYRIERKHFKETITARAMLPDVPVDGRHRIRFVMTGGRPLHPSDKCPRCEGVGYVPQSFFGMRGEL